MLSHEESVRLYGPWQARRPEDVAELFDGYSGRWWIAGGWAIEAFSGVPRPHDDVDPSIPRSDVSLLRQHLAGRLDTWAADSGTFHPILTEADVEGLPATCENLWLRASGADPWEYDVILMDVNPTTWTFKRDARISLPIDDIVWNRNGIDYLRPDVQLLHKANTPRPKDQEDFEACLPRLDEPARLWLAHALRLAHPGHLWLGELEL